MCSLEAMRCSTCAQKMSADGVEVVSGCGGVGAAVAQRLGLELVTLARRLYEAAQAADIAAPSD
jgi:hypothetical protein